MAAGGTVAKCAALNTASWPASAFSSAGASSASTSTAFTLARPDSFSLAWPRDGRDGVTAAEGLFEKAAAGASGGADDGDVAHE